MIRNAIIRKVEGRNDAGQYVFEAIWSDDSSPCTLRYIATPGSYESYRVDDVVMVALPYGDHTAGRIIGLFERSQPEPEDENNTELHARESGDIRIVGEDGQAIGVLRAVFTDAEAAGILLDADLVVLGPKGSIAVDYSGKGVARLGDSVAADTTMAVWISAVSSYINGLSPGTVTPPVDLGVVSSASSTVVAAD